MKSLINSLGIEVKEEIKTIQDTFLVTLKSTNLPFTSFGKGFSKEDALNSAYGEMLERVLTRNFLENYYINNLYKDAKPTEFLTPELKKFYQIDKLDKEDLIDFNSDSFEILSIPFLEKGSNQKVYFPINLIQNLYASNGMAFHKNLFQAYKNAKSEIIERYVKHKVIYYALPLPKISHPLNSKNFQVYDATLGGKYPVMAVSYIKDGKIILSFGCDLNQKRAIQKAYLEIAQKEFRANGNITDDIQAIRDEFNLERHFESLDGDIHINFFKKPLFKKAKWNFCSFDVFNKKEYLRIYKLNNHFAIQVIIPSISEVYSVEDMKYFNINYPKFERDIILNYQKYPTKEVINTINLLGNQEIGSYIGVIFKEPLTKEKFKKLILNKKPLPPFSQEYLNLKTLSQTLNQKVKNEI
jgi:ribosomal protein S12 methylthiotransferase accessory factor